MILAPGAHPSSRGTTFVVHAPNARQVAVRIFEDGGMTHPLEPRGDGMWQAEVASARPGTTYKLVLDGDEVPDPYARFLPFGVDGPARVMEKVAEKALETPPAPHRWVIYELHVGTFTSKGTYASAIERLDAVADLGVTAIELMPVAAFAGLRGWGYDAVSLFAPFAPYGEPDDLRALVRAAHDRGLAVLLDVIYNHLGPAGNYLGRLSPEYFSEDAKTPWGAGPNYAYEAMRRLAIDNARYWLTELGFDGLRLDATHRIFDRAEQRPHIVAEICAMANGLSPPRAIFLEDDRNDSSFVTRVGATRVWADDFHHQVRTLLTGERDGYYEAYETRLEDLVTCVAKGWIYCGQPYAPWDGRARGGPVDPLRPEQLVTCIDNHDQVGNRALGTRLSHDTDADCFCAAAMLLLFLPMTPLLFMGQEWAASSPFLFFSDHEGDLGKAVTRGRREEFRRFRAFADAVASIPDPQASETFERSKLRWEEREEGVHARVLALHRAMLRLRREDPVLSLPATFRDLEVSQHEGVLDVVRRGNDGQTRRLVVSFSDEPRSIAAGEGARALVVSGSFENRVLGARSAAVLA
jgi:maltooligosyltrehalose trehalohydrolase